MKQKFLQLLPLVAADLQLLCPVPLRKGSRVCLTDESILSGLSWEERGERNLIHSCALTYQTQLDSSERPYRLSFTRDRTSFLRTF